jgi:hypothetical protein
MQHPLSFPRWPHVLGSVVMTLLLLGCSTTGGGRGTTQVADVPSRCDDFYLKQEDTLHSVLLVELDKLEMANPRHPWRAERVLNHLTILCQECPRLVLPVLLNQVELPVHERQRSGIALILGLCPIGKEASLPVLGRLLRDDYPEVRHTAAMAILELAPNDFEQDAVCLLVREAVVDPRAGYARKALGALSDYSGRRLQTAEDARQLCAR